MKKNAKRILSMALALCLCLAMLPAVAMQAEAAAYDNTHMNTGNQAHDIVAVAQTQVGYQEGANNYNKYSAAFGTNNVEWCAYFVSWCAKEAGISDSIIHRQGIASPFSGYFNIPNTHSSSNYFPKPGDLVFYGPNSNGDHYHVGIVETANASTGYITTIEGNTNSNGSSTGYIVYRHTRHYQHSTICCYGRPNYDNTHTHNFTGTRVHESAHPHRISQRCVDYATCGGYIWTDEYYELKTCEQCWYVNFETDASSISVRVGESKALSLSFSGCIPDSRSGSITFAPDNGVAGLTYESKQFKFTGLKPGTTNFVFTIYSNNSKSHVIGTLTIPVTVTTTYTVSYNANGGTGAPDDQTKHHGTALTLSSIMPTRPGYTFLGWSTSSSATSATYQPSGSFTNNSTTTLYAVWKKVFYGDVNQDGVLNFDDILHMNKIQQGNIEATNWDMFAGDLDGDGSITEDDIELLNDFRTGAITVFPVELMDRALQINTYPQKQFCSGTKVDTSGLSVSLYYPETMASHNITNYCDIKLPSTGSAGTTATVYISFDGLNTGYTIMVTEHTYHYKVTQTPTVSMHGGLTGLCNDCPSTTTLTLPKLNTTDYSYSIKASATCTEAGSGRYTWKTTSYGSFYFDVPISATGHNYSDGSCTHCGADDPNYVIDQNVPIIMADTVNGRAGETVTVTVCMKNNPGFGGMAYDVMYDSAILELISYEIGLGNAICTDSGVGTYTNKVNLQYAGTSNITGDGALVTLTFIIKDSASEGTALISIVPEEGTFFTYEGRNEQDFDVSCVNGGIIVMKYISGDINGDGKVNNRDAARLLQKLAGWDVDYIEATLDVNGDGKVNNRDAARILQYLAGWDVELH